MWEPYTEKSEADKVTVKRLKYRASTYEDT
jgi:hypothetical protein